MKKVIITSLLTILLLTSCTTQRSQHVEVPSVYYEIFVASFYDSDGDGMGDLEGVRQKLDYIQHDLGATGIWLMPIHPSPTYHKYDVLDYEDIDKDYGTMEDFERLVEEMNERDMDLIIDFVLNHSSSKHPWFLKALDAYENDQCDVVEECEFYNFETRNPGGYHKVNDNLYYEGGFWSEMPDLNLHNETVRNNLLESAKFWLDKGVKGFRLDATTHFFDDSHEDNIAFLNWFNTEVKNYKEDAYIIGEAWSGQSIIEDMYRSEIDSFFNFANAQNSGNIVKDMQKQKGLTLAKRIEQQQNNIKAKNEHGIDAPFLSNHDNNRSAGYLVNLEDQKLAASIYLLLPGNPFIYYGEEVAMKGSGIDENKRLPMLWDKETSKGYTKPPQDATYTQDDQISVKNALKNKDSLLNHYKHVISIRNSYPDIARGAFEALDLGDESLFASRQNNIIVVHNLSDDAKLVEIDADKIVSVHGDYKNKKGTITLEPKSSILIEERQ
ncbi:MAG TPA: alpha-amylase family glycosyl hydrolase [Erysipelothrix sp.]|nr:alpha-amylase family glycosyl hydrolase [Erysipelothrix sp.]